MGVLFRALCCVDRRPCVPNPDPNPTGVSSHHRPPYPHKTNSLAAAGVAAKVEGLHDALVQKLVSGLQVGLGGACLPCTRISHPLGGIDRHPLRNPIEPPPPLRRSINPMPPPATLPRWRRRTTRPPWTWPASRRAASRARSRVRCVAVLLLLASTTFVFGPIYVVNLNT